MTSAEWLTYDQFAPRVGECFEMMVRADDEVSLQMELIEATNSAEPGGLGPEGQQRQQFSLVFRGPVAPVVPQGTYRLSHDEMGELELFLVAVGPDSEGMRYEAAFA